MSRSRSQLASVGLALVMLAGGGAVLACGGGASSQGEDSGSAGDDTAGQFAQCMRDNGIEDFPEPEVDADGGISIGDALGDQRDTEEFRDADQACQHILDDAALPEGEPLPPEERAELQEQWDAIAQCVRDRGHTFPDPEVDEFGRADVQVDDEAVDQAVEDCAGRSTPAPGVTTS